MEYKEVFENNKAWIAEKLALDPDYFTNLARQQRPDFLYIGCSDSRVPANEIMGTDPGDVFVHCNIANLVDNTDMNCQSVIQYAVEHLHVKYIVVCGHYNCGGIKAAMHPTDLGLINGWLRNITDVYRIHYDELKAIANEEMRYRRLVELNVMEQCLNIAKIAGVQKAYIDGELAGIYGWVYDIHNGKIIDLEVDILSMVKKNLDILALENL
ncbi:MAG: carbonic anhydrase [Bacteroidota bacterium]